MINIFHSLEYHRILFSDIIGKKHAFYASLMYHFLILVLNIVLIYNL